MSSTYDLTNEALRLWVVATGVDPDNNHGWGDVYTANKWIRVAQDADPTGLTTYLHLRAVAREYIQEHSYSALAILETPDVVELKLAPLRALIEALDHPDLLAFAQDFQTQLRETAKDQGVLEQTAPVIDDLTQLGQVRLDALHATQSLRRDTFTRGPRRSTHLRYNRRVLKFWNVNSLVRALEVQPEDGISLCLLRDPQIVASSFFAFAMRDGDTATMWSDAPSTSHPLEKYMSRGRRGTRDLQDRADALRFPYQLLDAKFVDEGRQVVDDNSGTQLVRTNVEAVTISALEELEPDQILWALMMFDLLRYQPEHEGELSCTGETLFLALTGVSQKALGTVEPLRRADITAEALTEQLQRAESRGFQSTHQNDWMEERYADRVDEEVYNLFGSERGGLALSGTSDVAIKTKEAGGILATTDPMSFGTATQMADDRIWVARHNQAMRVRDLAKAEFKRRSEKIVEWFNKAVRANSQWFLDVACTGSAFFTYQTPERSFGKLKSKEVNMVLWQRVSKGYAPTSDGWWGHVPLYTPQSYARHQRTPPAKCFVSGEIASIWTRFEPRTPEMLRALVGGVKLPDVLEHWYLDRPYDGNSILDRTDPMDSMIEDPWLALRDNFNVMLGLSLREFRRQCKARGIVHPEDFAVKDGEFWPGWRFKYDPKASEVLEEFEQGGPEEEEDDDDAADE
jgi:hypothetical protein